MNGTATGVIKGGKLNQKLRKLRVQGLAENIPEYINLNVKDLDLGKSIKVSAIELKGFTILSQAAIPVASVDIPRALRGTLTVSFVYFSWLIDANVPTSGRHICFMGIVFLLRGKNHQPNYAERTIRIKGKSRLDHWIESGDWKRNC